MSDLTEKVKRLRELIERISANTRDWRLFNKNNVFEIHTGKDAIVVHWAGFDGADCPQRLIAPYIAAANPAAMAELLDGLARLEGELVAYGAVMERQHARITSLEAALAAITTERRMPGFTECCDFMHDLPAAEGGWFTAWCRNGPDEVAQCKVKNCPHQHPTPSQGTTP